MIANKNVLLVLAQWLFIIIAMINKDQEEPKITPQHAKAVDHIAAGDVTKQRSNKYKWKKQKHYANKQKQCINTVYPLKRPEQKTHQLLIFKNESGRVSSLMQLQPTVPLAS